MNPLLTTTAPTAGLGQARPRPRRPSVKASAMNRASSSFVRDGAFTCAEGSYDEGLSACSIQCSRRSSRLEGFKRRSASYIRRSSSPMAISVSVPNRMTLSGLLSSSDKGDVDWACLAMLKQPKWGNVPVPRRFPPGSPNPLQNEGASIQTADQCSPWRFHSDCGFLTLEAGGDQWLKALVR